MSLQVIATVWQDLQGFALMLGLSSLQLRLELECSNPKLVPCQWLMPSGIGNVSLQEIDFTSSNTEKRKLDEEISGLTIVHPHSRSVCFMNVCMLTEQSLPYCLLSLHRTKVMFLRNLPRICLPPWMECNLNN